jgi:hypothetical protein
LLRIVVRCLILPVLLAIPLAECSKAQSNRGSSGVPENDSQLPPALVRSVRMVPGRDGPAVEIITTRPLTPSIMRLDDPPRVVIDLEDAYVSSTQQKIAFRDEKINDVRVSQFQQKPPIVRLVVDVRGPVTYAWDAAGNRLMIRLYPPSPDQFAPAFSEGVAPSAASGAASGAVTLAGNRVAGGSAVTAGLDTAILHMARGGEVRVCPGTTVSVTPSQNGKDLMLGMNTGSLEAHYRLNASADSILTPDFRILLPGPGEFHLAVSADSRGNTCVRTLPGNTASAVVSEVIGDGVYQVKPSSQVVFRGGRLSDTDSRIPSDCGCPAQPLPVMRASAAAPQANSTDPARAQESSTASVPLAPAAAAVAASPTVPALRPQDTHVQVDVPMVFRATDSSPPVAAPVASNSLPTRHSPAQTLEPTVLPPDANPPFSPLTLAQSSHHGFFGKVRGFFSGIFR